MLNKIIIMGRLTKAPELRYTQNQKPVVSFTLACDRDGQDRQTDFIDCVAWNKTAEFVDQYFIKGQMAIAEGRLQIREWTDRDNNKRRSAEVVCDRVFFGEAKRQEQKQETKPAGDPVNVQFTELSESDGDLPF